MKTIVAILMFAILTGCATHGPDMANPKRIELDNLRACMSTGNSFSYCDGATNEFARREQERFRSHGDVAAAYRGR